MGISITVDLSDLDRLDKLVTRLELLDASEMMASIASLGEDQTRTRILDEKTAPDGSAWPPNRAGNPILVRTGDHLLAQMASTSSADEAEWGSSWEFAHVHQEGMVIKPRYGSALKFWFAHGGWAEFVVAKQVNIPKREFIGISTENRIGIEHLVTDYFGDFFR